MSSAFTLNPNKERQVKKDNLIKSFFQIGASERTEELQRCKHNCQKFIQDEYDETIDDLIKIIESQLIYFKSSSKEQAGNHVKLVWEKIYLKHSLSFYDIRFLTCIMFTEFDIENLIYLSEEMLSQLDKKYKEYDDYLRVKMSINVNLLELLVDAKLFQSGYRTKFDKKIFETIKEIVLINSVHGIYNKYAVGRAILYQGMILKDEMMIHLACLLLKESEGNLRNIDDFIKSYVKKYGIDI